jgi:hypothetical protein
MEEIRSEENSEPKKVKISSELIIIALIGFLFGMAIKTEFGKRINVTDKAFYGKQGYDFAEMLQRQSVQGQAESEPASE